MGCKIQKCQNVLNQLDLVDQDSEIVINQIQQFENEKSQSLKSILKNRQFDMGPIFQDINEPKFQIDGMKSIQKLNFSYTDDNLEEKKLDQQQLAKSILKKPCNSQLLQHDGDKQTQTSERSIKKVQFSFCERHFCQRNKIKGQKCLKKKYKKQSVTMQQLDDEFQ